MKAPSTDAPKKLDFPNKSKTTEAATPDDQSAATDNSASKKVSDIKTNTEDRPTIKTAESFGLSPLGPGGSWADQVDEA